MRLDNTAVLNLLNGKRVRWVHQTTAGSTILLFEDDTSLEIMTSEFMFNDPNKSPAERRLRALQS